MFSNIIFQNKNYYQGFFFLYFAWLGRLCLLLIPMFISAPKHLGTGSVSGEFWTRQDVAVEAPPETPDGGKNSAKTPNFLWSSFIIIIITTSINIPFINAVFILNWNTHFRIFSQQKYYVCFWGEPVDWASNGAKTT